LAIGYTCVALWTETLYDTWWTKMVGTPGTDGDPGKPGYWLWIVLLPIGLMGYFVFSKKHNWMSRIPIGIILGLWSGQQIQVWWNRYGPQIGSSMKPILPTTLESFTKPVTSSLTPEQVAQVNSQVYPSQAITNIIFIFTLLSVLSYFLFSVDAKNKLIRVMSTNGRWLLMIGFGAIFGSTVMMRFSLLIDRLNFIWIEFLQKGILGQ